MARDSRRVGSIDGMHLAKPSIRMRGEGKWGVATRASPRRRHLTMGPQRDPRTVGGGQHFPLLPDLLIILGWVTGLEPATS